MAERRRRPRVAAALDRRPPGREDGRERVTIDMRAWHVWRLRLQGDRFMAWFDGNPMLEPRDRRIAVPGRMALWSIADSRPLFAPPAIEVLR